MKTTTILWAAEEALNQHNCWMDAYRKRPKNLGWLWLGEKRARQHDKFYQRLLSRIEAGDRAREQVQQAKDLLLKASYIDGGHQDMLLELVALWDVLT